MFPGFTGPVFPPGGIGKIVTVGILIVGGNGLHSGGQNPTWIVPMKGIVIVKHSGLSAGNGLITKVGPDPWEL